MCRYSDFIVREIDQSGRIVRLEGEQAARKEERKAEKNEEKEKATSTEDEVAAPHGETKRHKSDMDVPEEVLQAFEELVGKDQVCCRFSLNLSLSLLLDMCLSISLSLSLSLSLCPLPSLFLHRSYVE